MTVRVVADGADGYRLLSPTNEVVGWLRGRAIGVTGSASEDAAVVAATRAYGALARWLERQQLPPLPPLGDEPSRFVHDGAHRWILVGRVPVARFAAASLSAADAHAFEIILKGSVSEGMAIHAALVALGAAQGRIDAADIAWAGRRKKAGGDGSPTPTTHMDLEA